MSSISTSSGEGSRRSSRRPDSMRCQARRARGSRVMVGFRCASAGMPVAAAIDEMIVDHADRLHEGVDDRRAAEIDAARLQVFGDCARNFGFRRHFADCGGNCCDRCVRRRSSQRWCAKPPVLLEFEISAGRARPSPSILARLRTIPASCHQALDLFLHCNVRFSPDRSRRTPSGRLRACAGW